MPKRKRKGWKAWSESDDAMLDSLIASGMTHRDVSAQLGRSLDAVRSRIKQRGIKTPEKNAVWPDEQTDFLIRHYGQRGWSFKRMADALPGEPRRTPLAVKDKAVRLGLSDGNGRGHTQKLPPVYVERCLMLAMQDLTTDEIAERLGVSPAWAHRQITKHPYYARRYKQRESMRRSHGQASRLRLACKGGLHG